MLFSREISIPSRKVLKSHFLHRFASTGWLTASKAILARGLVKSRTLSCAAIPKRQSSIPMRELLGNCISKGV